MVMKGPLRRCCFNYRIFTTNSSHATKYSKIARIMNTHIHIGGEEEGGRGKGKRGESKTKKGKAF